MSIDFKAPEFSEAGEAPKYHHGYTELEVARIKQDYLLLQERVASGEAATLLEVKTIIIPHVRIHRTEAFNLAPTKVKKEKIIKEPVEKKPKVPKVKKMSKKERESKIEKCVFLVAAGQTLSPEDQEFFDAYLSDLP